MMNDKEEEEEEEEDEEKLVILDFVNRFQLLFDSTKRNTLVDIQLIFR
jgi:hypothetical protein